jgi:SAM-dependent methyltransferase
VGCGDGAVLSALHALSFGGRLHGLEISPSAVRIAGQRAEIDSVEVYDGERLPLPDGAHELGILCHVLEHVPAPAALLAEVGRVCGAVVVEVPLEANISALRPSRRGHSTQVGHLQRLDRRAVRELVADAGMRVAGELTDPLPVAVHLFFAQGLLGRVAGRVRWAVRAGLHRLAPTLARRVFTVHYACLCVATDAPPAAMDARPAVV